MRWPWQRQISGNRLIVSWSGQTLCYVLARASAGGTHHVLKFGVEHQGSNSIEDFARKLQGLGLRGLNTKVMLRPQQYQLLQIDAPAVPPEELRAAARYQIREMLDSHVDDVTLDVMRVGDGLQKGAGHLFVVTAANAVLRSVLDLGEAMHWSISVIDIQETAQRNLQNAAATRDGYADRARALLVVVKGHQAVLTITANDELFYSRWFELPDGFMTAPWARMSVPAATSADSGAALTLMDEYVPEHGQHDLTYGDDLAGNSVAPQEPFAADDDKTQRLLVEVQRSLDVWERTWSNLPLHSLRVYAGERSDELAKWLSAQIGLDVTPMALGGLFTGMEGGSADDRARCLPLLGVLMRTESTKL